jgi:hypothetical protein
MAEWLLESADFSAVPGRGVQCSLDDKIVLVCPIYAPPCPFSCLSLGVCWCHCVCVTVCKCLFRMIKLSWYAYF